MATPRSKDARKFYRAAARLIEGGDWLAWQLTGVETRSSCAAGYKALWSKADGFPASSFFAALDPAFAAIVADKLSRDIRPIDMHRSAPPDMRECSPNSRRSKPKNRLSVRSVVPVESVIVKTLSIRQAR